MILESTKRCLKYNTLPQSLPSKGGKNTSPLVGEAR